MIYTPLTNKAMRIAYEAHHGQLDASGQPYIFHPIHLAEQMEDEITACVALLHDVIEDTFVTFGELAKRQKKLVLKLMREVFSVAKAQGCRQLPLNGHNLFRVFGGFWAKAILPRAMKAYYDTRSGMIADLERGRRTDVDFVAGAVVSEGERRNVETPYMKRAVALVHDIENGLAEMSPESLELLLCD